MSIVMVGDMDDPLGRLPAAYADYIRLHRQGVGDAEIAARLEIDPDALRLLARLAYAKLASLTSDPTTDVAGGGPDRR